MSTSLNNPTASKFNNIGNIRGTGTGNGGNLTVGSIIIPQLNSDQTLTICVSAKRTAGVAGGTISCNGVSTSGVTPHSAMGTFFCGNSNAFYIIGASGGESGTNLYTGSRTLDVVLNANAGETWEWSAVLNIIG